MRRSLRGLPALFVLGLMAPAFGQVIIIDRRPNVPIARSYEVREVNVDARVRDQVAEVQVSQTFHNPGLVPDRGRVLLPAARGRGDPELRADGGRQGAAGPDPAQGRGPADLRGDRPDASATRPCSNTWAAACIRTSVFPIPPGADRKVTMRYTQICKRDRDVVEFAYPFGTQKFTAKPIQRLALTVRLESKDADQVDLQPRPRRRDPPRRRPQRDGQARRSTTSSRRPTSALVYTLAEGTLGATVLSYRPSELRGRLLPAAGQPGGPQAGRRSRGPRRWSSSSTARARWPARRSSRRGSRSKFVLNNLREDDLFNIVVYDDRVEIVQARAAALLVREARRGRRGSSRTSAPGGSTEHRRRPEDGAGDAPATTRGRITSCS